MSTPLIFKSISIRNFMSFGNAESTIELDGQGTVTVTGENFDQGGSNGSGKTTIINALCYALYNKPFDNISLQRLINTTNATKNTQMEVRLIFEKDGIEYEIYRARGEDYRIEVRKDGEDITPGKGVYETDDLIQEIIGISYELFTKTIIFSGNSPPFLQLPIHFQRNQIEELFNITMLSEKAKQLKDLIRITEADIKVAEAVVTQQEVAINLHEKHIKEALLRIKRWEESQVKEIASIEATLAKIATIDFEGEQTLHDEKTSLQQRGAYLAAKLAPARKDRSILTARVEELMKEQEHLLEAKCPYCTQPFADAPSKLVGIENELEVKGTKLLEVEEIVTELLLEEDTRKQRLSEVTAAIKHVNLSELIDARTNSSMLRTKIEEMKSAGNPHTEALEKLVDEGVDAVNTNKVDKLRSRLNHQQFLLKLLTDKNSFIRRRIINKTIPFLNNRLNFYTSSLGLPHVVKFDADMSCTVAEFGRELDFGNLSAGEKKRLNTAMALAFRDVLHHLHAKTNLLIIDELDGGLDQQGIDSIIKMLKEKSRDESMSVFIISHHPSVAGRLDKDLKIRKENGFSSVVFD
jgi:DNA repair exonuclease SbcCD ATPase subunit